KFTDKNSINTGAAKLKPILSPLPAPTFLSKSFTSKTEAAVKALLDITVKPCIINNPSWLSIRLANL
ncbi:MAG TPA: hypothetical protein PL138_07605, partial [Bacillota bacterium]|nr:hypothetical protein [Bacillota bacterium]